MSLALLQVDPQSCHLLINICDRNWTKPGPDLGIQYNPCLPVACNLTGDDVFKRVTLESVDQDSVTRTFNY